MGEKQKMAAAEGGDTDIFAYYAEPPLVAVNLFHLRGGHIVDRREFFWEDRTEFDPPEFFASLLKQVYLDDPYVPAFIHVPVEFEEREVFEEFLVGAARPQSGDSHAAARAEAGHDGTGGIERAAQLRAAFPRDEAVVEGDSSRRLQDALGLENAPRRIECFDISHIQGTDKVASMVVWEDGRMKKSDYRKFIIRTVEGNDDFASMREVISRRYGRLKEEGADGRDWCWSTAGWGSCTRRPAALEELGITDQPLASIAKREEWIYVYGQEDEPIVLDKFSPGAAPGADGARRGAPVRGDVSSHAAQCEPPAQRTGSDSRGGGEDGDETTCATSAAWSGCARLRRRNSRR